MSGRREGLPSHMADQANGDFSAPSSCKDEQNKIYHHHQMVSIMRIHTQKIGKSSGWEIEA